MKPRLIGTCAAAAVGLVLAGCNTSSTSPPNPSPTTPTTNPTQAVAEAAIDGYHVARKVQAAMEANPRARLADYPATLHITDALTGQALDLAVTAGAEAAANGWKVVTELAGSPPTVKSIDLAEQTAVLVHCPVDERRTLTIKGQPATEVPPSAQAKPPYLITYTMQRNGKLWKLARVSAEVSRTCTSDT